MAPVVLLEGYGCDCQNVPNGAGLLDYTAKTDPSPGDIIWRCEK